MIVRLFLFFGQVKENQHFQVPCCKRINQVEEHELYFRFWRIGKSRVQNYVAQSFKLLLLMISNGCLGRVHHCCDECIVFPKVFGVEAVDLRL